MTLIQFPLARSHILLNGISDDASAMQFSKISTFLFDSVNKLSELRLIKTEMVGSRQKAVKYPWT